jgi:type IV pilus assembly protein PilO
MNKLIEKLAGIQTKPRWGLVLGVVIGIFVAFYMVSYKKSQQELKDIQASIEDTRVKVTRLRAIEKRLPKFEEDIKKLRKRMEISMSLLPEKKEIPELLTKISRLGSQSGLEFVNFQPGIEKMQNFYAEVPVAITVKGGYHELATFLDRIRTLRRIVHVRKLQLGAPDVKRGVVTLNAKSTLVTYRFLSPQEEKEAAKASKRRRRRR